jgi:hypothetical protein
MPDNRRTWTEEDIAKAQEYGRQALLSQTLLGNSVAPPAQQPQRRPS